MARPRKVTPDETNVTDSFDSLNESEVNDIYQDLMSGTQAHLVSDTSKGVLHDRPKIPTPLPHLNCLFGGGIPLGTIVEAYGEPACFTGDTKIHLSNGDTVTLQYLYENQMTDIPVYNCTPESKIIVANAESVYLSKHVSELIEIEFCDKYVIRCTPDHPFLIEGYKYVRADQLHLYDPITMLSKVIKTSYSNMNTDTHMYNTMNTVLSFSYKIEYLQPTKIKTIQLNEPVPVYGIVNAGEYHNYVVALSDTLGAFVSNSGKSSFAYKMMGEFQQIYPKGKGVCIILDTEASVDSTRMHFLGCDPNYMLRIPAGTVEKGFEQLYTILDKKYENPQIRELPVFILWDGEKRPLILVRE